MASSSELPSADHREDLPPTDAMVEKSVPNEVRLSKRERNPYPYPYLEHVMVEELAPMKLEYEPYLVAYVEWNKNYVDWRRKMLDVITREGLLGFIDGTVQAPPKTVITTANGPNGSKTIPEEYVAWKRSDDLVREWILNRLDWGIYVFLDRFNSAKELWEGIAEWEESVRMGHYLPLYKAAIKGDWEAADEIINEEQDAVRARITFDSETALIVAVKMVGGKDFVEKLVEKMSSNDLAICDDRGRTALHRAAEFGNIEVAKLLVERNTDLPNMETHWKETPLFYAAERGDRKMVEWLMEVTGVNKMLWNERGFRILYQLTHSQLYDIALKVLERNSWLAFWDKEEDDLKFQALTILAGTPSSFKSGHTFNYQQELIYSSLSP